METMRYLLGVGLEPKDYGVIQVCVRGVIVFVAAIVIVRCGHKRFMSRMTAFDMVLGFILASMLSRAINGSAGLMPTLAAGLLLVLLHRLMAALVFVSDRFNRAVNGNPDVLVEDGKENPTKMRKHKISEKDILEEARMNGRVAQIREIHLAVLERSGKISVLPIEQ